MKRNACTMLLALLAFAAGELAAGPLRERLADRRASAGVSEAGAMDEDEADTGAGDLPAGVRVLRDIAYGSDRRQRFDVYVPAQAKAAPVIFMVHGGGWRTGDKAMRGVVDNKLARWSKQGYVLISVNYRLLPQAEVAAQLDDVTQALKVAQQQAAQWGADRHRFVLMGHSAGAHLVSLLASGTVPEGMAAWLGTVALDSAAFDVDAIMRGRHFPLYDKAFGSDPAVWTSLSPIARLAGSARPMLAVCSSRRTDSCPQAQRYAARAGALGRVVQVLPVDLTHKQINHELGQASAYTDAVDGFIRSLGAAGPSGRAAGQ